MPGAFGEVDALAAGDAAARGTADTAGAGCGDGDGRIDAAGPAEGDGCGDAALPAPGDAAGAGDGDGSSKYASVVPSRASTNDRTRSTVTVRGFATSARSVMPRPSFGRWSGGFAAFSAAFTSATGALMRYTTNRPSGENCGPRPRGARNTGFAPRSLTSSSPSASAATCAYASRRPSRVSRTSRICRHDEYA